MNRIKITVKSGLFPSTIWEALTNENEMLLNLLDTFQYVSKYTRKLNVVSLIDQMIVYAEIKPICHIIICFWKIDISFVTQPIVNFTQFIVFCRINILKYL